MAARRTVYLASPLGFAESTRPFMDRLLATLSAHLVVVNPWDDHDHDEALKQAEAIPNRANRIARLAEVNTAIARANEERIRACDAVIAVLDGVDVDSGTASEIGFAYALGKRIDGLRTDFRRTGENEAAIVNLQVRYWIDASGGRVVASLQELEELVISPAANP